MTPEEMGKSRKGMYPYKVEKHDFPSMGNLIQLFVPITKALDAKFNKWQHAKMIFDHVYGIIKKSLFTVFGAQTAQVVMHGASATRVLKQIMTAFLSGDTSELGEAELEQLRAFVGEVERQTWSVDQIKARLDAGEQFLIVFDYRHEQNITATKKIINHDVRVAFRMGRDVEKTKIYREYLEMNGRLLQELESIKQGNALKDVEAITNAIEKMLPALMIKNEKVVNKAWTIIPELAKLGVEFNPAKEGEVKSAVGVEEKAVMSPALMVRIIQLIQMSMDFLADVDILINNMTKAELLAEEAMTEFKDEEKIISEMYRSSLELVQMLQSEGGGLE